MGPKLTPPTDTTRAHNPHTHKRSENFRDIIARRTDVGSGEQLDAVLHDDDRAVRLAQQTLADRAEQCTDEPAMSSGADDD